MLVAANLRQLASAARRQTDTLPLVVVHVEHPDRRPADGSQSDEQRSRPAKMLVPPLGARIEQHRGLACRGVDSGQIARFGQVAVDAGQRDVFVLVTAAMLAGNDVFDLQLCHWRQGLR